MLQILKGNTHDLIITLFLQDSNQMRIENLVEHLRWSFLRKLLTAVNYFPKKLHLGFTTAFSLRACMKSFDSKGNS